MRVQRVQRVQCNFEKAYQGEQDHMHDGAS
jgi:hypothetical protein